MRDNELPQINQEKTMDSREIAELCGKEHRNVLADIDKMFKDLGMGSAEFSAYPSTYINEQNGQEYRCYKLNFDLIMTLISGYNVKLRHKIVSRWTDLETGVATPIAESKTKTLSTRQLSTELKARDSIAAYFGLEGNQKKLSVSKSIKRDYGVDPMAMVGVTHLIAEKQELNFTPTQIGKQIGLSAQKVNKKLSEMGFQVNVLGQWKATEAGKEYCLLLDTGKAHSDGTPVLQIKWKESVIEAIKEVLNA